MGLRIKPCGHGPLCTRLKCQEPKPLKLSRRDAKTFVGALVINDCPICRWGDGTHNSSCWIGALAIKWREAEASLRQIKAALADGGVVPETALEGVRLVVRERAEYSRKYHEATVALGAVSETLAEKDRQLRVAQATKENSGSLEGRDG